MSTGGTKGGSIRRTSVGTVVPRNETLLFPRETLQSSTRHKSSKLHSSCNELLLLATKENTKVSNSIHGSKRGIKSVALVVQQCPQYLSGGGTFIVDNTPTSLLIAPHGLQTYTRSIVVFLGEVPVLQRGRLLSSTSRHVIGANRPRDTRLPRPF